MQEVLELTTKRKYNKSGKYSKKGLVMEVAKQETTKRKIRTYTGEENKYIFSKIEEAKEKGLDAKTVITCLADEFNVSYGAMNTKYYGMKRAKQAEQDGPVELPNNRGIQDISDVLESLMPAQDIIGMPSRIGHGFVGVNEEEQTVGYLAYAPSEQKTVKESVTVTKETKVEVIQETSTDPLVESALRVVRERDEYKRKYEEAMVRLRKLESIFNS
jgi:hypothetical protein